MGAIATDDGKGKVNVEINIVPFIDLMSCLAAFLLVTAVWVNVAQLSTSPKGRGRDTPCVGDDECERPRLSVLVEHDQLWIGVSRVNTFDRFERTPAGFDWPRIEAVLRDHKSSPWFRDYSDIEIAASSTASQTVEFQQLVAAMDVALRSGFSDIGISDPAALSARPML